MCITYLCSFLNVQMTPAIVKRLRLGWTLCPASLILKPWLATRSTRVAHISFITIFLRLQPQPRPPLTLTPLPL